MRVMIEQNGLCKAFRFDGRKLNIFLKQVQEVNGKLDAVWSYSHVDRKEGESVGVYMNVKNLI
jgi:hypothetical protein